MSCMYASSSVVFQTELSLINIACIENSGAFLTLSASYARLDLQSLTNLEFKHSGLFSVFLRKLLKPTSSGLYICNLNCRLFLKVIL